MSLTRNQKVAQPAPSIRSLAELGVPALYNQLVPNAGFSAFLERLSIMAGLNFIVQVNDCEDSGDWSESDDTDFDFAIGTAGKRVGTNALKLTSTTAGDASQYVETRLIDESVQPPLIGGSKFRYQDWRDTRYLGFWSHAVSSAHFGTDGELQVAIVYLNHAGVETVSSKVNVPGNVTTVHAWIQIDMESEEWQRDRVVALRFYNNNANTSEDTYIDDIIRYQHQYNGGPMYGCSFPIKSATVLSENDIVKWSIDGLIKSSSSAAVTDLGPGWLGASTLTGTAKRNKYVIIPGAYIFLVRAKGVTIAGEGVEWGADNEVDGVSTGVDEKGFAKALEAAGAENDWIMALKTFGGNFIS